MDKIIISDNKRQSYDRFNFERNVDYRGLDEEYKRVLIKFGKDLETSSNVAEREKILYDFINEFIIIPNICQLIIGYFNEEKNHDISNILKTLLSQFYNRSSFDMVARNGNSNEKMDSFKKVLPFTKCFDYNLDQFATESSLFFPNSHLENRMKDYDEKSDRPLSKEKLNKYEKATMVSHRLLSLNMFRDYKEFIKICFEWNDKKFAYQTIEYRLSINYKNKSFWFCNSDNNSFQKQKI